MTRSFDPSNRQLVMIELVCMAAVVRIVYTVGYRRLPYMNWKPKKEKGASLV